MRKLGLMMAAIVMSACGGATPGAASPEEAMKVLVDAAKARDAAKAAALFPSDDLLTEYLDCPADAPLVARVVRVRGGIGEELVELARYSFVRRESGDDQEIPFAVGDSVDDCKAKKVLTSLRTRIVLADERGEEDPDRMRFVRLGERWFLVGL